MSEYFLQRTKNILAVTEVAAGKNRDKTLLEVEQEVEQGVGFYDYRNSDNCRK